jgi:hypothetical protein
MLNKKWKIYLISAPLLIAFFWLFVRYVPWLFGSHPINRLNEFVLENTPAPEGALSFAINHGRAMYFYEPVPGEVRLQAFLVIVSFFVIIALLFLLGVKHRNLDNDT